MTQKIQYNLAVPYVCLSERSSAIICSPSNLSKSQLFCNYWSSGMSPPCLCTLAPLTSACFLLSVVCVYKLWCDFFFRLNRAGERFWLWFQHDVSRKSTLVPGTWSMAHSFLAISRWLTSWLAKPTAPQTLFASYTTSKLMTPGEHGTALCLPLMVSVTRATLPPSWVCTSTCRLRASWRMQMKVALKLQFKDSC